LTNGVLSLAETRLIENQQEEYYLDFSKNKNIPPEKLDINELKEYIVSQIKEGGSIELKKSWGKVFEIPVSDNDHESEEPELLIQDDENDEIKEEAKKFVNNVISSSSPIQQIESYCESIKRRGSLTRKQTIKISLSMVSKMKR